MDRETGCLSLSLNLLSQLGFELDSMTSQMPKCHSETENIYFAANLEGTYWIVLFCSKVQTDMQSTGSVFLCLGFKEKGSIAQFDMLYSVKMSQRGMDPPLYVTWKKKKLNRMWFIPQSF